MYFSRFFNFRCSCPEDDDPELPWEEVRGSLEPEALEEDAVDVLSLEEPPWLLDDKFDDFVDVIVESGNV
jgi:hypothetical protein